MGRIYCPTAGAEDWKRFLADPEKHWASGYSARTLASCWEAANGALPPEIASLFRQQGSEPELLIAIPEHKVPMPGSHRGDSQNDVFALVRANERTFAVTIEGKVKEPFGPVLGDWLKDASNDKRDCLQTICRMLDLPGELPRDIHYQLLHRSASAVIEAERFKTDAAATIIHSFSPERLWFDAFEKFVALFGRGARAGELIELRSGTRPLYAAWACGDCAFLMA
jgi:hypothetical protein